MRIAALVACLALAPSLPPSQTPLVPSITATGDTVVNLLSTGAEPRRALRYSATAGAKERLDMTMQISMAMTMGEMSMPPIDIPAMTMAMDMDVTEVNAAGDITFKVAFGDVSLAGGVTPPEIAALKGMGGSMTMTSRGVVKAMDFSAITDPAMKQLMSSAGIEKLSTPLPAEPLGVGGRWDVTQSLAINGINTTQKLTFEVVSLDAASVTIKSTIAQTAPAQKPQLPGMPPGAEVSLVSLEGSGAGTLTLSHGALMPLGDTDVQSKVVMDISAEGQSQRMSTSTRTKVTLAKGKR